MRKRVGDRLYRLGCSRFLSEDCIDDGKHSRGRLLLSANNLRELEWILYLSQEGGKFEDALQPKVGGGSLSLHWTKRLRMYAPVYVRRKRSLWSQCGASDMKFERLAREAGYDTPISCSRRYP